METLVTLPEEPHLADQSEWTTHVCSLLPQNCFSDSSVITTQMFLELPHDTLYLAAEAACYGAPDYLDKLCACIADLSVDQLVTQDHRTVSAIAKASFFGFPCALNQLTPLLHQLSLEQLANMCPRTIPWIVNTAVKNKNPDLIDALAYTFRRQVSFVPDLLIQHPQSLASLAMAACHGYPFALTAVSPSLRDLSADDLAQLDYTTIEQLAAAACRNNDSALTQLAVPISLFSVEQLLSLSPATIHNLAIAAAHGSSVGLRAIVPLLVQLTDFQFTQFVVKDIGALAYAAANGSAEALDAITPHLLHLSPSDLMGWLPETFSTLIAAANAGHPNALMSIGPIFKKLSSQLRATLDPERNFLKAYAQHAGVKLGFCSIFSGRSNPSVFPDRPQQSFSPSPIFPNSKHYASP